MTDYGDAMLKDELSRTLIRVHTRPLSLPAPASGRWADWALSGPLTAVLIAIGTLQLVTWLPHYLTWPYWADHDVFATAARAWVDGKLPYRDTFGNNFPGTLYLFAAIGLVAGWERPWAFFAVDAVLLLAVLSLMLTWSRQRFGRALPGAIGGLHLLGYYLSLDYCHTGQRDWHATALAVLALMVLQMRTGRAGRLGSALLGAVAIWVRPQAVLLIPALFLGVTSRDPICAGETQGRKPAVAWLVAFAVAAAAGFAPLYAAGVLGDFIRSIGIVAYGGTYNHVTIASIVRNWLLQATLWHDWVVIGGFSLWDTPTRRRRGAWRSRGSSRGLR